MLANRICPSVLCIGTLHWLKGVNLNQPKLEKHLHTNMDEISKLSYEGSIELLRLKLRDDNSLATKPDEVCN